MRMKTVFNAIGIIAILLGLLLIAGVFFAIDFDFSGLNSAQYRRLVHLFGEEEFTQVEINTSFFDVKVYPLKEGEKPSVLLPQSENIKHNVTNENGRLSIAVVDDRAWYEKWSFGDVSGQNTVIEVYLPHAAYEELKILVSSGDVSVTGKEGEADLLSFNTVSVKTSSGGIAFHASVTGNLSLESSSGDVTVSGAQGATLGAETSSGDVAVRDCTLVGAWITTSSGEVALSDLNVTGAKGMELFVNVNSGDIEMRHIKANGVRVKVDTADVALSDVLVAGELRVEADTGEIEIARSDAGSLWIETDTGDVEIELLTGKIYSVEVDTGDVKYPEHDKNGGACHVKTDTGDVEITVLPQ